MAFWFITQQLHLFPDMRFHRIMTRTILGKFISRKPNDKVSWKYKKSTYVVCFAVWNRLSYYRTEKHLSRYVNFSEGYMVVCSFPKTKTPPYFKNNFVFPIIKLLFLICPKFKTRHIFWLFWLVFLKFPKN